MVDKASTLESIALQPNSDRLIPMRQIIGSISHYLYVIAENAKGLSVKALASYQRSRVLSELSVLSDEVKANLAAPERNKMYRRYVLGYSIHKEAKEALAKADYTLLGKSNFATQAGTLLCMVDFSNRTITPVNGHDIYPIVAILRPYNFTVVLPDSKKP